MKRCKMLSEIIGRYSGMIPIYRSEQELIFVNPNFDLKYHLFFDANAEFLNGSVYKDCKGFWSLEKGTCDVSEMLDLITNRRDNMQLNLF